MKRVLPLVIVAVVALLAFGSALGVNSALRLAVALPEGAVLDVPGVGDVAVASADSSGGAADAPRTRGLSRKQYIDAILERNIFDHTKIGLKSEGGEGGEALTDLNVRLLATIVAQPQEYSSALIAEEGRDGKASGYGIGDKLFDAEIVGIEKKKVTLKRSDGTIEVLTMEAKTDAPPPREAATPGGDDAEGIAEVGDNKYTVDRSLVDKYLTDIEAVSKMARAIPHRGPDGEIDGYRLSGIRRNSPLSQLGIRNGDVIHQVNGHSLSSMQDAMGAYQQLQGGSSFTFEVTRRGQRQTMEYEIR